MANINAPRNVMYFYRDDASPHPSHPLKKIAELPYTDVIVAFLTLDENNDVCMDPGSWPGQHLDFTEDGLFSAVKKLKDKDMNVLIAIGGGSMTTDQWQYCADEDYPENLTKLVNQIVENFVKKYGFSGVDIDFEDEEGFKRRQDGGTYEAVPFLINLTNELHKSLPDGQNIITHAPQSPHWISDFYCKAYSDIHREVGHIIAWYNNQFYNNASFDHDNETKVRTYKDIVEQVKVDPGKLLMGVTPNEGTHGHVTGLKDVKDYIIPKLRDKYKGFGGVMTWQFAFTDDDWAKGIANALGLPQTAIS